MMGLLWKATLHSYSKVRMWYYQDIPGPQDCQHELCQPNEVPSRAQHPMLAAHHYLLSKL